MAGFKVLVVDDEIDICEFLTEYIEEKEMEAYYSTEIENALEIASEVPLNIIFLDNNLLSNTRGVEYIPEFKKLNPECKVYMLTANIKSEVKNRALELGASGFISKPFDFEYLNEILEDSNF